MKQDQINGVVRALLTLAGTYLFGHNIFGTKIDESLWQEITGTVMVVVSFIWTIRSKALTIEIFQSTILKVFMVGGALLVTSGKLTNETFAAWTAALTAILPVLYSILSKSKSAGISNGDIPTKKLSQ